VAFYLDTSVIVPLLITEIFTERARNFLTSEMPVLLVSDFAAAEWASVISRRVRTGEMTHAEAMEIFATFDTWRLFETQSIELEPADVRMAEAYLRRLDLTLLAPDALHIAMARRAGAVLVTFDEKMGASARNLGVDIAAA
jgi:predicted nucleic acid-binding protein